MKAFILLIALFSLGLHAKETSHILEGRVLCGYQGWFAAEGDGTGNGWHHYSPQRKMPRPGSCTIDLWPDLTGFDEDEKFPTDFLHADGSTAHLFSSAHPKTVMRHFSWMKTYGIDGVFLQRFGARLTPSPNRNHLDTVLANVRTAATVHDRSWAMMYDISGLKAGDIQRLILPDWRELITKSNITADPTYLHHQGRPVVAVWGIGFSDGRNYTLEECAELVRFLRDDPEVGGNAVMLGVPTYWRTLQRDAVDSPLLHDIIAQAHIVSPWSVGRTNSPESARRHAETNAKQDVQWTNDRGLAYLPVAFPGFSWHNLKKARGGEAAINQIPRRRGDFLWAQGAAYRQAGANMLYVAMFDELDEATAIIPCLNAPPIGESPFVTYEDLPTDHYLWLTGKLAELYRSSSPPSTTPPRRE